jgi:N-acetylmuramoyl-L-alanine amidase
MRYHYLLDNGHGGVINGIYTTCPNYNPKDPKTFRKMYIHNGVPIYEGEFNRIIVGLIAKELKKLGIKFSLITPELQDIPLQDRVKRANDYYNQDKNCIFVSVHGNAANTQAKGFEVFSSIGQTRSDAVAEVFATEMEKAFPGRTMRWDLSDKDKDKESDFYVLSKTNMPAILTENFFMDNLEDAKIMMSKEGQERIAQAHVSAILKIENDVKKY